jgi:hypothetical protein
MDRESLEGVAHDVHERTFFTDGPVDMFDLTAHASMKMPIKWVTSRTAYRVERCLFIPRAAANYAPYAHGLIAHEASHVLLDDYGIPQSEAAARYLAAALLVAWRRLDRQLRAGWDLSRLMGLHPYASAELLARRIVDVRRARFSVWDAGRLRYRIGGAIEQERELVRATLESGEPQRTSDLDGAWPIFRDNWRRVIVLAA